MTPRKRRKGVSRLCDFFDIKNVHPIALLVAMAVGAVAVICTILIHALPLSATRVTAFRETLNYW